MSTDQSNTPSNNTVRSNNKTHRNDGKRSKYYSGGKKPDNKRPVTHNGWNDNKTKEQEAAIEKIVNERVNEAMKMVGAVPAQSELEKEQAALIKELKEKLAAKEQEVEILKGALTLIGRSLPSDPLKKEPPARVYTSTLICAKDMNVGPFSEEEIKEIHKNANIFKCCDFALVSYEPKVEASGVYSISRCGDIKASGSKFCARHLKAKQDRKERKALALAAMKINVPEIKQGVI